MAFDPLVANPGRLTILATLASSGREEFAHLRRQSGLTDGNLASHAKRLQSGGLIEVEKSFRAGKPVTQYILTSHGRRALEAHVQRLLSALGGPTAQRPEMPSAVPEPAISDEQRGEETNPSADDDWID